MGSAPSVITERASGARLQLGGDRHHRGSVAGWGAAGGGRGGTERRRGRAGIKPGGPRGWDQGWKEAQDHLDQWTGQGAPARTSAGDPEAPEGQHFHPRDSPIQGFQGLLCGALSQRISPCIQAPPGEL